MVDSFMETIEYFSDFLRKTGTPNLLAIGVVVIVIWLLVSGLRKGWRKRHDRDNSEKDDNGI
jgi:Na+/H+ antiporter NhaD/arsenite permease-like protein